MRTLPRLLAVVVALPLLAVLAACSDSGDDSSVASLSSASSSPEGANADQGDPDEQGLKFAQCMRDNGVDLADPSEEGGPVGLSEYGDEQTVEAALAACQDLIPQDSYSAQDSAAAQERLLAYTKCMRDNGVDMADPAADGGLGISLPDSPEAQKKFEEANKICAAALDEAADGAGK